MSHEERTGNTRSTNVKHESYCKCFCSFFILFYLLYLFAVRLARYAFLQYDIVTTSLHFPTGIIQQLICNIGSVTPVF